MSNIKKKRILGGSIFLFVVIYRVTMELMVKMEKLDLLVLL